MEVAKRTFNLSGHRHSRKGRSIATLDRMSRASRPKKAAKAGARTRSPRHRPEDARGIIVRAAIDFLAKRPYRELNVGVLMAATPLSRPAFYRYFTDVEDLIEQLLAEFERGMQDHAIPWFSREVTTAADSIRQFRASMEGLTRIVAASGPLYRAISEAASMHPGLEQMWSRFMGDWDSAVARRIRLEQQAGLIEPALESDRVAHAFNRMDAALMIEAFGRGRARPADIKRVVDTMCEVWIRVLWPADSARSSAKPADRRRTRSRAD